jgi:hypothetical protein
MLRGIGHEQKVVALAPTLIAMNDTAQRPGQGAGAEDEVNDSDGRLATPARLSSSAMAAATVRTWVTPKSRRGFDGSAGLAPRRRA